MSKFGNFPGDENNESEQVSVAELTRTSNAIGGVNQNTSKSTESNNIKDFLRDFVDCVLPNPNWCTFYNTTENAVAYVQRDEDKKPIKRVYFRNSFVPDITINDKPFEFKRAVKTINEVENLLEEINELEICTGFIEDPVNETCIGYFKRSSEEIIECHDCKLKAEMIKKEIASKAIKVLQLQKELAELQRRTSTLSKKVLEAREKLYKHGRFF